MEEWIDGWVDEWMDGWMDGTSLGNNWMDGCFKESNSIALSWVLAREGGKRMLVKKNVCYSHACMHAFHPPLPSDSYTSPEAFTFSMPSPKASVSS
ncbi:unnamed protein product [Cercopithifilaria johnstoni]|uniref:Uncharacterized protein n=1 Tax=Cercopithifilaria johnstoni TaxID=2874296 RepID=A0A8J2M0K2_9BILA|nr:unnamed protein product [Cercopithifilaria johnstoni]